MTTKVSEEAGAKREAIVLAARTLFAKKNYEETTIADIAREAGIAVGTVYLYFRNKREVYTAVALDIESLIADAFRDPQLLELPFAQVPRTLVDELFRISREHKNLMALLQIDIQSAEEGKQHKYSHQQVDATLVRLFEHAIQKGELAPFNTQLYSEMLIHLGNGTMHQCFGIEKGEREAIHHQYLLEFIERLFFGPPLCIGSQEQAHT